MNIIDGDIFHWNYKDEKPSDLGPWQRYHCKSQIAVAADGRLRDTYWGAHSSDRAWTYDEAEREISLVRIGNFNELEKRGEHERGYYDDGDCVDLNHANSSKGNFYIRKGARRSRAKMLATLAERIDKTLGEMAYAQRRLDADRATHLRLEGGDDLAGIYL